MRITPIGLAILLLLALALLARFAPSQSNAANETASPPAPSASSR